MIFTPASDQLKISIKILDLVLILLDGILISLHQERQCLRKIFLMTILGEKLKKVNWQQSKKPRSLGLTRGVSRRVSLGRRRKRRTRLRLGRKKGRRKTSLRLTTSRRSRNRPKPSRMFSKQTKLLIPLTVLQLEHLQLLLKNLLKELFSLKRKSKKLLKLIPLLSL